MGNCIRMTKNFTQDTAVISKILSESAQWNEHWQEMQVTHLQLRMLCKRRPQWFSCSTRFLIHAQVGNWCRLSHTTEPSSWGHWVGGRPGFSSKASCWEACSFYDMAPPKSGDWKHLLDDPLCVYLLHNQFHMQGSVFPLLRGVPLSSFVMLYLSSHWFLLLLSVFCCFQLSKVNALSNAFQTVVSLYRNVWSNSKWKSIVPRESLAITKPFLREQ